jgi:AcrR family transcriptional regulator
MGPGDWSPNQLDKRDRIVHAAAHIMAIEGVAACTARSVSAACSLSTSAIHYYFKDTDEIFDLAFRRVMDRFFFHIEHVSSLETDPVAALWAASCAYLRRGSEGTLEENDVTSPRRAPMLWFEFQAQSLRSGDLATVRELSSRGANFFGTLLQSVGVSNPEKAEALYCALLGAAIRDSLFHQSTEDYVRSLLDALELPTPKRAPRAAKTAVRKRRSA